MTLQIWAKTAITLSWNERVLWLNSWVETISTKMFLEIIRQKHLRYFNICIFSHRWLAIFRTLDLYKRSELNSSYHGTNLKETHQLGCILSDNPVPYSWFAHAWIQLIKCLIWQRVALFYMLSNQRIFVANSLFRKLVWNGKSP